MELHRETAIFKTMFGTNVIPIAPVEMGRVEFVVSGGLLPIIFSEHGERHLSIYGGGAGKVVVVVTWLLKKLDVNSVPIILHAESVPSVAPQVEGSHIREEVGAVRKVDGGLAETVLTDFPPAIRVGSAFWVGVAKVVAFTVETDTVTEVPKGGGKEEEEY